MPFEDVFNISCSCALSGNTLPHVKFHCGEDGFVCRNCAEACRTKNHKVRELTEKEAKDFSKTHIKIYGTLPPG